jgi:hypothetical protein
MANTKKATKAAEAALDAAAAAAKDAKRLSKTLPKKDAKKLRSLADETKDAAHAPKKKLKGEPRKVEKKAVAAIERLDKAVDKAEAMLAARAKAGRKAAAKKAAEQQKADKKASKKKSADEAKAAKQAADEAKAAKKADEKRLTEQKAAAARTAARAVEKSAADTTEPGLYDPPPAELPADAEEPKAAAPLAQADDDLSSLTVVQLRERARAAGHAGFSRYTKAQLLALLSS